MNRRIEKMIIKDIDIVCKACQCKKCHNNHCPTLCKAKYPCMEPVTKCLDFKPNIIED